MPNDVSWPNVQSRARKEPMTVAHALKPPSRGPSSMGDIVDERDRESEALSSATYVGVDWGSSLGRESS